METPFEEGEDLDTALRLFGDCWGEEEWLAFGRSALNKERLDLAEVSLAHLGNVAGVILHRRDPSHAEAAIQLGLLDNLKKTADPLSFIRVLMATNRQDEAISVAEEIDYKGLSCLHHQFGRSLEIIGKSDEAISHYQMAGTLADELPRIRIEYSLPPSLDTPSDLIWKGHLFEATGRFDEALKCYRKANDQRDVVHLLLSQKDFQGAINTANSPSLKCLVARALMAKGQLNEKEQNDVITLFQQAKQTDAALRFAADNQLGSIAKALALSANQTTICYAARLFEDSDDVKTAIFLYTQGRMLNRALMLGIRFKRYDALEEICELFTNSTSHQVLFMVGKALEDARRYGPAVKCFALGGDLEEVEFICNTQSFILDKAIHENIEDRQLLLQLAAIYERQNALADATKIYTRLKEYDRSFKCLMRTGHTSKIIRYAELVKKKEIYIKAANYLQSADMRKYYDKIVDFYFKASSFEDIVRFSEATARLDIDESLDYQGALERLKNGAKLINRLDSTAAFSRQLNASIIQLQMYITAMSLIESDPDHAKSICKELQKNPTNRLLRAEDIKVVLIQCYVMQNDMKSAFLLLDEISSSGVSLTEFFGVDEIKSIYAAVGKVYSESDTSETSCESIEDCSDFSASM